MKTIVFCFLVLAWSDSQDPPPLTFALDGQFTEAERGKTVDDTAFLQRLTSDLWGTGPAEVDLKPFLADPDPRKRAKKIDQLLADDRFADFWARRFSEAFCGDPAQVRMDVLWDLAPDAPAKIVKNFTAWLGGELKKDRPWSEIVGEMLRASGKSETQPALGYKLSFFRGKGYPEEFAQGVAQQLLGIRLYCARCHDHPFDQWTVVHYYGLAAFVARENAVTYGSTTGQKHPQVELRTAATGEVSIPGTLIESDIVRKSKTGGTAAPIFLFGRQAQPEEDRADVLAHLMTARGNTQLRKALANRVWAWLLGRGIVHPFDDFNFLNKPVIRALESLARDLLENGDSVKRLVRAICNTRIYQRQDTAAPREGEEVFWRGAKGKSVYDPPLNPMKRPDSLPLTFETPAGWVQVRSATPWIWLPPTGEGKMEYVVPGKKDRAKIAALSVFKVRALPKGVKQDLDRWSTMIPGVKAKSEAFEGKHKGTLTELAGPFTCHRGSDGPVAFRILAAELDAPEGPWYCRLAGPAEVVDEWQEEFTKLLKRATK